MILYTTPRITAHTVVSEAAGLTMLTKTCPQLSFCLLGVASAGGIGAVDDDIPLKNYRRCVANLKLNKTVGNQHARRLAHSSLQNTRKDHSSHLSITKCLHADIKNGVERGVKGSAMGNITRYAHVSKLLQCTVII